MAKMTKYEFEDMIDSYARMDLNIRVLADQYADKFDSGSYVTNIEVDYDGVFGTVTVSTEYPSHCGCCPSDYGEFTFPLRYLYEDDWVEQEQEKRDVEQRKRDEEKKRKEAEQKKQQEEAEYKRFLRLKEKYE